MVLHGEGEEWGRGLEVEMILKVQDEDGRQKLTTSDFIVYCF